MLKLESANRYQQVSNYTENCQQEVKTRYNSYFLPLLTQVSDYKKNTLSMNLLLVLRIFLS